MLYPLGSGIYICFSMLPVIPSTAAEAATKSAAASGLPPYQAVEPTATAAARWGKRTDHFGEAFESAENRDFI